MGQILHGSATTTHAVRAAIQRPQASATELSRTYGSEEGQKTASAFLEALVAAVPYRIHTVLTDNGIQFTFPPRYRNGPTATCFTHMFDMRRRENGIERRLTMIKHPWTNGQVERMLDHRRRRSAAVPDRCGRQALSL